MKLLNRNNCIVTGNEDLEHIYTFNDFPVFMGCVENEDPAEDVTTDMSWWISKDSGSIQLNPVPDLNLIYPASHGSGTIGKAWELHHTELGEFVLKYAGTSILEIGGGHGFLASYILDRTKGREYTLIDPNPSTEARDHLNIVKGFFPVGSDRKYDTIVHSHLFEHMIDPLDFCEKIFESLNDEGYLIFSVPNLGEILARKYTNVLNFEHTVFLNEYLTEYFLQTAGFDILEKKFFLDDHSIFYAARKSGVKRKPVLINQYSVNLRLFKNYIDHHVTLVNELNNIISGTDSKVFIFGAHVMSQFLIAFGLDIGKVQFVIDNDPNKLGRRLNGTSLMVQSPLILKKEIAPIVILRAGAFQSEISEQLKSINHGVQIIPSAINSVED